MPKVKKDDIKISLSNIRRCDLNNCWFSRDQLNRTWISFAKKEPRRLAAWILYTRARLRNGGTKDAESYLDALWG